jgi:hypothetical protein
MKRVRKNQVYTYVLQPKLVDIVSLEIHSPSSTQIDDMELDLWLKKQLVSAFQGDHDVSLWSVSFNQCGHFIVELNHTNSSLEDEDDTYSEDVLECPVPTRDFTISWNGKTYTLQNTILNGPILTLQHYD